jgi:hypothetical protein
MLEDRVVLSTLTVTSSADDVTQNHTLRYAVAHAQSGDTILLTAAVKDPIVLTQGELVLSQDVTIQSVPSRTPTISGGKNSRIFEIAVGASVTLSDLNLIDGDGMAKNPNGTSGDDGQGGAILNLGTLAVSDSTFTSSSASVRGGGLANINGGTATVSGSTFTSNSAHYGGGIDNESGTVTVSGSTFASNSAGAVFGGGGIFNNGFINDVTAPGSGNTFTGNTPDDIN